MTHAPENKRYLFRRTVQFWSWTTCLRLQNCLKRGVSWVY